MCHLLYYLVNKFINIDMPYSEEQLRQVVDKVFKEYDKDNSGFLDVKEATQVVNDSLKQMKDER